MVIETNMAQANGVLKALKPLLKAQDSGSDASTRYATVKAYGNGREQGYNVSVRTGAINVRTVIFSESRGSDSIVVYTSKAWTDELTDDMWENHARYFDYKDYAGAAAYCFKFLCSKS